MVKVNIQEIRAELEQELTWRTDEIRFLKNRLEDIAGSKQKMLYRKSLVVMLYSHYEGFFKFALLIYVRTINAEGIKCSDANSAIVAGAWHEIFKAMEQGDKKERIFRKPLPGEDSLHRYARRREFVEQLPDFQSTNVTIPDTTIDTESNLWPEVLQKNLYRVGLQHDIFGSNDGTISKLVNRRNDVAHGSRRDGLTAEKYSEMERAVFRMMDDFMLLIVSALRNNAFKKPTAPSS